MIEYGTRKCLWCGKEFTVEYANHVTCSDECNIKRRKELKRLHEAKRRAEHKDVHNKLKDKVYELETMVSRLQKVIAELEQENKELAAQNDRLSERKATVSRLQKEAAALKQENESLVTQNAELKSGLPVMEQCLRSNVKALHLPCGKNELCWKDGPCERCKDMEKPSVASPASRIPYIPRQDDSYFDKYRITAE